MSVKSIPWILLLIFVQDVTLQYADYEPDLDEAYVDSQLNCSTTESIKSGNVTYSQGGLEGSVLTYHCSSGQYPFPVSSRLCGDDGEWSPMRLASGRLVSRATCKDILCPAQLQLDNGDFWPRDQWLGVGATQSFTCQEGFTLSGSANRNCTDSGDWTGTNPICSNHGAGCSDPGVPPGAHRSGRFHTGEMVVYRCQTGLDLLGSAERVCLEDGEWSGSSPRCQGPNTFDSPSNVAAAIGGSLAGLMDVVSPDSKKKETSFGRTFHVAEDSRMNVYILLDTSGSITAQEFDMSRNATIALIEKLDSYEVQVKFHMVSFASEAKDIVDITESQISGSTDDVISRLMKFDYRSHKEKTGTNLYAALQSVRKAISLFKEHRATNHFDETQNVIVIQTDGYSNVGIRPQAALAQIRNLLGYDSTSRDHTNETRLDVYVFGVGEKVDKIQLNSLASMKRGETHVFILKDFISLGYVFNSIISDESVTKCGIAREQHGRDAHTRPWHATVTVTGSMTCSGSIVSQNWVLTAAHCFGRASTDTIAGQVQINHGEGLAVFKKVIMHPQYNISALKHRNVTEFYDYDVALVQVAKSIPLSWKARPICLPCTVPASRAMRKVNSTCREHSEELLPDRETAAFFIHDKRKPKRKATHIHPQSHRPGCVQKANQTLIEPTDVTLEEYVPDRFLCSGGSSEYRDAITCTGDSGGSLFLQKRNRYFQVGVVSWGTTNVCDAVSARKGYSSDRPPPDARDFHINLFKVTPWLKKHLGEDIQFLPEVN